MYIPILESDGGSESVKASRLLTLAGVIHLVQPVAGTRYEGKVPRLHYQYYPFETLCGLEEILDHLRRVYHFTDSTVCAATAQDHPPHDDRAYARMACVASQGGSL